MSPKWKFLAAVAACALALPVANHASASAAEPLRRDLAGARQASVGGQVPIGVQEPAWSPDGKRVAVSYLDRIWTMTPDGKQAKALATSDSIAIEREPAWSHDGTRLAYAADRGEGFDIFVVAIKNGVAAGTPVAVQLNLTVGFGELGFDTVITGGVGNEERPSQVTVILLVGVSGSRGFKYKLKGPEFLHPI